MDIEKYSIILKSDLSAALKEVKNYFADAKIEKYNWGSTINIIDSDGNRVGIRDRSATFS